MKKIIFLVIISIYWNYAYAEPLAKSLPKPLPKPWYQTNLEEYESGYLIKDDPQNTRYGYLKSKEEITSKGSVLQHISPPEEWLGRRIRLTAFVKVDISSGAANIFMAISHGFGFKTQDYMKYRRLEDSADWQELSIVLDVPDQRNADILFGVDLRGKGEIYFDDFKFEEVTYDVELTGETIERKPKKAPANLSFENDSGT